MSIKEQNCYIQGLEDFFNDIKAIFECSVSQRKEIFGETDVANILDKYDFVTIHETVRREIG